MQRYLIIALLLTMSMNAQHCFHSTQKEYFTFAVLTDPVASIKEGGLYIGAEVEYVGFLYTRLGVENFQVLEDGYTSVIGGIGMNQMYGFDDQIRAYAGIRLGVINRQETNATIGIEWGADYNFNNWFIGGRLSYDYRSDQEFYDYPNSMKYSGYLRIGTKF